MIWLIIGVIACIGIIIYIWCDQWNDLAEKVFFSILTLFLLPFIAIVVLLISSAFVSGIADIKYNMESDTKIIALKDNQDVNGSFYIMGGYVNEDLYYYYAIETEFGYKTEKVMADNTYIKYTDGETHIERYTGSFVNDTVNFWAIPVCNDRYIIYCPYGTVTNEFVVDLE